MYSTPGKYVGQFYPTSENMAVIATLIFIGFGRYPYKYTSNFSVQFISFVQKSVHQKISFIFIFGKDIDVGKPEIHS